jgi:hypothetical protein
MHNGALAWHQVAVVLSFMAALCTFRERIHIIDCKMHLTVYLNISFSQIFISLIEPKQR